MRWQTSLGIAIGTGLGTLVAATALRSRRAIDFAGRTVVIFGGSRGLGLAMAREFAAGGAHVVLAAREIDGCMRPVAWQPGLARCALVEPASGPRMLSDHESYDAHGNPLDRHGDVIAVPEGRARAREVFASERSALR